MLRRFFSSTLIVNALKPAKTSFRRLIARNLSTISRSSDLKVSSPLIHNISSQRPFDELFQFIKKNTVIPNFLSNLSSDHPKAQTLLTAIQSGDANAKIFQDPDCYLYLLYLMKTEPEQDFFWQCITVYVYLMARMQFSEPQAMNQENEKTRFVPDATIDVMVRQNQFTNEGEKFIVFLQQQFKDLNYSLDPSELKKFILTLPPVEQWLIKIPYVYSWSVHNFQNNASLLEVVLANIPFCRYVFDPNGKGLFWLPSFSVINYLLQKISDKPIRMVPILGSINIGTLRKMHEQGKHPVALSALHVKSNVTNVHGRRCGFFHAILHDLFHTIGGSMLLPSEREMLFNCFIPTLESLFKIAEQHNDKELMDKIKKTIEKAVDFNLSNVSEFCGDDRLILYCSRAFGNNNAESLYPFGKVEFEKIGASVEDRFYFLLLKMQHELPEGKEKKFWDDIIHLIPIGEYYRQVTVIHTIKQLARHALHQTNHFFVKPPSKEASRYEEPEMALGNQMRRSK